MFYSFLPQSVYKKSFDILVEQLQFLQTVVIYVSVILTVMILFSTLTHSYRKQTGVFRIISNIVKYLTILLLTLAITAIVLKFSLYLKNFKAFSVLLNSNQQISMFICSNTLQLSFNSSILSDVVLLLGFFSGLVALALLGEKSITKFLPNSLLFSFFFIATALMVYTTNLLVMFISFELLFLPTLYFVYFHGYVQRTDKTLKILFYWTLSGAFLVLSSLAYLYFKYKTLNYFNLSLLKFSKIESTLLFFTIFVGFGVKVPVYPFHYWLTKIHVEAPAGFSIFLSGFLVKAALFCFFQFNVVFATKSTGLSLCVISFFTLLEASVKMWTIVDVKKLIAYATIQEMSLILFLLTASQNKLDYSLVLFIIVHGLLSTLMFLLVDIIQKKTQTRNVVELSGVVINFPKAKNLIWFIILLFSGFPLTVKFSVEWQIVGILTMYSPVIQGIVTFGLIVIGSVGYIKNMLIIMYGISDNNFYITPIISKQNKYIIYLIISLVLLLNTLNLFLF